MFREGLEEIRRWYEDGRRVNQSFFGVIDSLLYCFVEHIDSCIFRNHEKQIFSMSSQLFALKVHVFFFLTFITLHTTKKNEQVAGASEEEEAEVGYTPRILHLCVDAHA